METRRHLKTEKITPFQNVLEFDILFHKSPKRVRLSTFFDAPYFPICSEEKDGSRTHTEYKNSVRFQIRLSDIASRNPSCNHPTTEAILAVIKNRVLPRSNAFFWLKKLNGNCPVSVIE